MPRSAPTVALHAAALLCACALGHAALGAGCPPPAADEAHASDQTLVATGPLALAAAVRDANLGAGTLVLVEPGTYLLDAPLVITRRGLTVRGSTGNREDVVLRGRGPAAGTTHVLLVEAADFTLADLTVGWVRHHAVQVRGERDADRVRILNVRLADTGQQLFKVSGGAPGAQSADQGLIAGSLFEYTAGHAPGYYSGGIDVHRGQGWIVRDNVLRNIRSPELRLAEHAIHFWNAAAHTLVERNRIYASDRGIGFGLGERGHRGGIIRNNMVRVVRDVGIGLENSRGTLVANNTVLTDGYPNAIEYRFPGTADGLIENNLTNAGIIARDGGEAHVRTNFIHAEPRWFRGADSADLRLALGIPNVIDAGDSVAQVVVDVDCEPRPLGNAPDIGADETGLAADPALAVATSSPAAEELHYAWRKLLSNIDRVLARAADDPLVATVLGAIVLVVLALAYGLYRALHIGPKRRARR